VTPLDVARVGQVATLDDDGDVDLADFAVIQACAAPIAGDRSDACGLADIDMDGDVDAIDFQRLLGEYAGPAEGS
jgi:hypothetical protein